MARPKVLVTRQFPDPCLPLLRERCEVDLWDEDFTPIPRPLLLQRLADTDGLLAVLTERVDAEMFDAAPKLRVVSTYGVGYDNIDVAEATRRGVLVTNTPGVLVNTLADITFGLLIDVARRISEADRTVRVGGWAHTWSPTFLVGRDIHGATLGIVGLGGIGSEVARRASGFRMRVRYCGRTRKPELEHELGVVWNDFETLLRESDFVSLHCALNAETRHLIDERALRLMKATAFLINTSRGGVVDQAALVRALREGWIAGAGLDVTTPEPLPADDPLLRAPNCVITPHIGSASIQTRARMSELAARNLLAALAGERPPHPVNPEVLSGGG